MPPTSVSRADAEGLCSDRGDPSNVLRARHGGSPRFCVHHPVMQDPIEILYQDSHYVAIRKPPGVLVHRTAISQDRTFVLQQLRDQLGRRVYPVHRLDRATSGVLVFALSPEAARRLVAAFTERRVSKGYLAVVRGYAAPRGLIDRPLSTASGGSSTQSAITRFRRLATVELPYAVSRYPTARYSLVLARPATGRQHQLRRHFSGADHPIVGDTTYGDGSHNRFFREQFGHYRLLLMARSLAFVHPFTHRSLLITAPLDASWRELLDQLGWSHVGRRDGGP